MFANALDRRLSFVHIPQSPFERTRSARETLGVRGVNVAVLI
jgi:hypothetical protein